MRLEGCNPELAAVAGYSLQTLSLFHLKEAYGEAASHFMLHASRLTAMTRLKFIETRVPAAEAFKLQQTSLVELCMHRCIKPEDIFLPGALPGLQKLHIVEDAHWLSEVAACEGGSQRAVKQFRQKLLGLPELVEISGLCRIHLANMPEGWEFARKYNWGACCKLPSGSFLYEQTWRKSA